MAQKCEAKYNSSLSESQDFSPLLVLIDNDPLILLMWSVAAKEMNVPILTCINPVDFLKISETLHYLTKIYIDSNLEAEMKGEEVAEILHQNGFKNIYLTTGTPSSFFSHLTFLKGVVGKMPPWEKFA